VLVLQIFPVFKKKMRRPVTGCLIMLMLCGIAHSLKNPSGVIPSNTPDGDELVFRNKDGDLPWPITRGTDIGQIIPHGPHCLKMIDEYVAQPPNNVVDRFHHQHCVRLMKRAMLFLRTEPSFNVHPIMCRAIHTMHSSTEEGSLNCAYAGYQYGFHSLSNNTITGEDVYNALNALTKTGTQRELFALINGQNLGLVLMKDYLDEPMNSAEIEMLLRWESEETVMFASIGVLCAHDNSKSKAIALLDALAVPPYAQTHSLYRKMN
jgi:hypothetical protein